MNFDGTNTFKQELETVKNALTGAGLSEERNSLKSEHEVLRSRSRPRPVRLQGYTIQLLKNYIHDRLFLHEFAQIHIPELYADFSYYFYTQNQETFKLQNRWESFDRFFLELNDPNLELEKTLIGVRKRNFPRTVVEMMSHIGMEKDKIEICRGKIITIRGVGFCSPCPEEVTQVLKVS